MNLQKTEKVEHFPAKFENVFFLAEFLRFEFECSQFLPLLDFLLKDFFLEFAVTMTVTSTLQQL